MLQRDKTYLRSDIARTLAALGTTAYHLSTMANTPDANAWQSGYLAALLALGLAFGVTPDIRIEGGSTHAALSL